MNYRETLNTKDGELYIGGLSAKELVERFGTPLYVLDETYIREVSRSFADTISKHYGEGAVAFASKAFASLATFKIAKDEGLSLDVVSGGELYAAMKAGFPTERMFMHGNNKLPSEIKLAVESGVGYVVVDHPDEIDMIADAAKACGKVQKVLLRVNPGVEAHTFDAVQTAKPDSKFGWSISDDFTLKLIERMAHTEALDFCGLHSHIGSQIFDTAGYDLLVDYLTTYLQKLNSHGIEVKVLDLGGGFGITYTSDDPQFSGADYARYVERICEQLSENVARKHLKKPYMVIEPGRSIVGEAGVTLYTVGAIKDITGLRKYVAVDGGMFDNPRCALYGSRYEAVLATRTDEPATEVVTIAGKCCESGDVIARDVKLAPAKRGDILAVFATGAYNYSMASNYNMNAIPPVVLVCDGNADYIVKPQTYDDLLRRDVLPVRLAK